MGRPRCLEIHKYLIRRITGGENTMQSQRRDLWGVLQIHCDRMGKAFLKATSLREIAALESKWLDPRQGVIFRLMKKPILSEAKPEARKVFEAYLRNQVRHAAKYSRIWMDD